MQYDLRILKLKLQLIEDKTPITLNESQFLLEFAPAVLLVSWLKGKAVQWISDKIKASASGALSPAETAQKDKLDKEIQTILGDKDQSMGSILTAWALNMIQSGNPVSGTLETIKSVALAAAKEQSGFNAAAKQAVNNVADAAFQNDAVVDTLAPALGLLQKLEPLADKWEAATSTAPKAAPAQPATNGAAQPNTAATTASGTTTANAGTAAAPTGTVQQQPTV